jgi:methyltransferase
MTRALIVAVLAFGPMLIEAARSRRNERVLRGRGAVEPAGDVYAWMQVAYPSCFAAITAEALVRGEPPGRTLLLGAVVFAAAKALKYWAITVLGERWTFRVLVVPGAPLITAGPYRWLRHPNYVGVAGEILGTAIMAPAPVAGTISFIAFSGMMLARIRVEERALDSCAR